jgi:hypothetical protein
MNKAKRMLRDENKAGRRLAWSASNEALAALDRLR